MSAQPRQYWTIEEYLAFERSSDSKHEYLQGDVVAMAGASAAHNIITGNIVANLHSQVRRRNCTVFPSDMRLKVVKFELYTYPDSMVVCGDPIYEDSERDNLLNPTVIIEVLSPTTENYDRGKKAQYYRSIPTVKEYLLVSQDNQYIEHFVRQTEYQWLFVEVTVDSPTAYLDSIQCTLTLEDVYDKVPLA